MSPITWQAMEAIYDGLCLAWNTEKQEDSPSVRLVSLYEALIALMDQHRLVVYIVEEPKPEPKVETKVEYKVIVPPGFWARLRWLIYGK